MAHRTELRSQLEDALHRPVRWRSGCDQSARCEVLGEALLNSDASAENHITPMMKPESIWDSLSMTVDIGTAKTGPS
jgi:hypothetical protein